MHMVEYPGEGEGSSILLSNPWGKNAFQIFVVGGRGGGPISSPLGNSELNFNNNTNYKIANKSENHFFV